MPSDQSASSISPDVFYSADLWKPERYWTHRDQAWTAGEGTVEVKPIERIPEGPADD